MSQTSSTPGVLALPSNHNLEHEALGAILRRNALITDFETYGGEQLFDLFPHRLIFREMARLAAEGRPIDHALLQDAFQGHRDVTPSLIVSLGDGQGLVANAASYGGRLADYVRRRTAMLALRQAERGYADLTTPAVEITRELEQALATTVAPAPEPATKLECTHVKELAANVDAAGPRSWLIRGIWPEGDYGALGAEAKAGKTQSIADLAVAVASQTPFLGRFPVDARGPVVLFLGEGGSGNSIRRLRAEARARNVQLDDLPIHICLRAPHLADAMHLARLSQIVAKVRPVLVVLDPFYLSVGGANMSNLYGMGQLLEGPQHICQSQGAALLVSTHYNRKEGATGPSRLVGSGPAEWGRILMTLDVESRRTEASTKATTTICTMRVRGGEVPDLEFRLTRRMWAADPDDLNSDLFVETAVDDAEAKVGAIERDAGTGPLPPACRKILDALVEAGEPTTIADLVDAVADRHGHALKRETASRSLAQLERLGLATSIESGRFARKLWQASSARDTCDLTRDRSHDTARVITCDPPYKGVTRSRSRDAGEEKSGDDRSHGGGTHAGHV